MAYEVVGIKRKRKLCQIPFMRRIDDKPVVKFTNYDKYDRREVLKKNDDDDDDDDDAEFDDSRDCIYRDSESKVILSFKTRADGTVNNLLEGTYELNKLRGTYSKEESQYSSDDKYRKEADSTLNRRFEITESMVNRENRFGGDNKEGIDPEDEPLDEGGWLVFSGGHSERKKETWDAFEAQIRKKGFTPSKITNWYST